MSGPQTEKRSCLLCWCRKEGAVLRIWWLSNVDPKLLAIYPPSNDNTLQLASVCYTLKGEKSTSQLRRRLFCMLACEWIKTVKRGRGEKAEGEVKKRGERKKKGLGERKKKVGRQGPTTRNGVRTHVCIRTLDLKSNALTTRPPWYDRLKWGKERI